MHLINTDYPQTPYLQLIRDSKSAYDTLWTWVGTYKWWRVKDRDVEAVLKGSSYSSYKNGSNKHRASCLQKKIFYLWKLDNQTIM